jgi:hypothetical protein
LVCEICLIFQEKLGDSKRKKRDKESDEVLEAMPTDKAYKRAVGRVKELEKELAESEKKRSGIETLAEAYLSQVNL